jgi:hypothetical protein
MTAGRKAKASKDRLMLIAFAAAKQPIRWIGVALSGAAILFAALSYFGFWSYVRGDDLVSALADRLDTSYAEVSRQVRPPDPEWRPLIRIITRYTRADLPRDKQPQVFARSVAVSSAKSEVGEWTASTTPILLLYGEWPTPGKDNLKLGQTAFIVGTIGDLHEWVRRDQADFDFFWRTLIFGALSVCVGAFLALPDRA